MRELNAQTIRPEDIIRKVTARDGRPIQYCRASLANTDNNNTGRLLYHTMSSMEYAGEMSRRVVTGVTNDNRIIATDTELNCTAAESSGVFGFEKDEIAGETNRATAMELARQMPNGSTALPNSINVFHVNKNTNIGGKPMNKKYSSNRDIEGFCFLSRTRCMKPHSAIRMMKICRNTNKGRLATDCRIIRGLIRYALLIIATHRVKAAIIAA